MMNNFFDLVSDPWHWSVSGAMIALVMFLLLYFGGEFGVSGNLRTICAIGGAGKRINFFKYDWKSQLWNLVFVLGAIIGGFIASNYLKSDTPVQIAASTVEHLSTIGIETPNSIEEGHGFLPDELFDSSSWYQPKSLIFLIIGGFLVGFGTRYAGGCTSGHAISGLANLQLPSLIAVIGFFIGGLIMTHLILPLILPL